MSVLNYRFIEIISNENFMSCEKIFYKKINDYIYIYCLNFIFQKNIDIYNREIFINNINLKYGYNIRFELIDFIIENNVLAIKAKTNDKFYFDVDEFANGLIFYNENEQIWNHKTEEWKLCYLVSIYSLNGYTKNTKKQIIIKGNKIKTELDFFCDVGFSINDRWGYIGNNFYNFSEFLSDLSDDICFIWHDYEISEIYLNKKSTSGYSVLENINMRISEKHNVVYK